MKAVSHNLHYHIINFVYNNKEVKEVKTIFSIIIANNWNKYLKQNTENSVQGYSLIFYTGLVHWFRLWFYRKQLSRFLSCGKFYSAMWSVFCSKFI